MKFEEIWDKLVLKDVRLLKPDTDVTFKAKNLKKLLQQVFDQGVLEQKSLEKPIDRLDRIRKKFDDIMGKRGLGTAFDDIFGDLLK